MAAEDELEALPVLLDLRGADADRLRRAIEGELGWQPVAPDGAVPPRLRLADVRAVERWEVAPVGSGPPLLLIVAPGDPPERAAAVALRAGAAAVHPWPSPVAGLAAAVARLVRDSHASAGPPQECWRIGGAAGGVGTTTVALALGGLLAWEGAQVLVVAHGWVPGSVAAQVQAAALAAPGLERVARGVRGVPGLRVLRAAGDTAACRVHAGPREVVVRDDGVAADVDVLVCRRDPAGLEAISETTAGAIVVCDEGVVPLAELRRRAGGRRMVVVPRSVRVARAAALGRVPASLPGSWLRALRPVLGRRASSSGVGSAGPRSFPA